MLGPDRGRDGGGPIGDDRGVARDATQAAAGPAFGMQSAPRAGDNLGVGRDGIARESAGGRIEEPVLRAAPCVDRGRRRRDGLLVRLRQAPEDVDEAAENPRVVALRRSLVRCRRVPQLTDLQRGLRRASIRP